MNDADIEMSNLQDAADHHDRLARRGICTHGHTQGGVDRQGNRGPGNAHAGPCVLCLLCGRIYANEEAIHHSRELADIEGMTIEGIGRLQQAPAQPR